MSTQMKTKNDLVYGWRIWSLYPKRGNEQWEFRGDGLYSVTPPGWLWPRRKPMRAFCVHTNQTYYMERIPHLDCDCGIHAFKFRPIDDSVASHCALVAKDDIHYFSMFVVGIVALWGKIVEHDWGYRAEYAYPKRLTLVFSYKAHDNGVIVHDVAAGLAAAYGVKCKMLSVEKLIMKYVSPAMTPNEFFSGRRRDKVFEAMKVFFNPEVIYSYFAFGDWGLNTLRR